MSNGTCKRNVRDEKHQQRDFHSIKMHQKKVFFTASKSIKRVFHSIKKHQKVASFHRVLIMPTEHVLFKPTLEHWKKHIYVDMLATSMSLL